MSLCVAVSALFGICFRPRGAVPCVLSVALSFFMSAAQLRSAVRHGTISPFGVYPPVGCSPLCSILGVYKISAPCGRYCYKRSLMARDFLFFVVQVQSLAHTHVGSSPIVGPFFGRNF
jgi:hypothetical protein